MFESLLISKLQCNVAARREVIRQDGTIAEDRIEAFKKLRCETDEWPKFRRVVRNVSEEMIFDFRDDFRWVDGRDCIQQICVGDFEICSVFGRILYLGVPKESGELADSSPCGQIVRRHNIVDVEDGGLDDGLQLFTDERVGILHDVLGTNRVNG